MYFIIISKSHSLYSLASLLERQSSFLATANLQLIKLNLLPLMYHLELADIMLYINSELQDATFWIMSHQLQGYYTRSLDNHRLNNTYSRTNTLRHIYYNRLPRLYGII